MTLKHLARDESVPAPVKKERPSGGELSTGPSLERYATATIKQIVLHFQGTQYNEIIDRLRDVMAAEGVKTHREAFLAMLRVWEEHHED